MRTVVCGLCGLVESVTEGRVPEGWGHTEPDPEGRVETACNHCLMDDEELFSDAFYGDPNDIDCEDYDEFGERDYE